MTSGWKLTRLVAVAIVAVVVGVASRAEAGAYYEGKDVTVIVPNSPSGRMTQYAQMLAPYLKKHLGARNVRIENRKGGGGLKGTNILWVSDPDGLTIAFTNVPTLILAQLADSPGVKFDATKFSYLGRVSADPRLITVGRRSKIKSIADVKSLNRPFSFASQGTDEDFYTMAVLADALGYELKIITGYEGNADTSLAVIKGDADGHMTGWGASASAVGAGQKRPILFATGKRQDVAPDVPTALEVLEDESKRASVEAIVAILDISRGFFGPPNMAPAAVVEMRAAISAALVDSSLLAEATGRGLPIVPASGEEVASGVKKIVAAGDDLRVILKGALKAIQ